MTRRFPAAPRDAARRGPLMVADAVLAVVAAALLIVGAVLPGVPAPPAAALADAVQALVAAALRVVLALLPGMLARSAAAGRRDERQGRENARASQKVEGLHWSLSIES